MKLSERIVQKIANVKEKFAVVYENNSCVTGFNCDNVIDVIKKFNSCYNSCISLIYEIETGKLYCAKDNKKADCRGNINQHYIDVKTKKVVFNEDELTTPIVKLEPSEIDDDSWDGLIDKEGNFFKCHCEGHNWLAKELFLSKTLSVTQEEENFESVLDEDWDLVLEERGWVKISSLRILHRVSQSAFRNKLTAEQKRTVVKLVEATNKKKGQLYEFLHHKFTVAKLLEELQ
jgi:hypothetical protein